MVYDGAGEVKSAANTASSGIWLCYRVETSAAVTKISRLDRVSAVVRKPLENNCFYGGGQIVAVIAKDICSGRLVWVGTFPGLI